MTSSLDRQTPRHGAVSFPPSRASRYLDDWQANGLEAGKFFPATDAGLPDPLAPDDVRSAAPPPDGKIASAGQEFAAELDAVRTDWQKTTVRSGQELQVTWNYHAPHLTRRWNYYITKPDWAADKPLSRVQFEPKPFHQVQLTAQPYWSHSAELMPSDPTTHRLRLPERRGYHVILAVWEIADTGNAFYQVVDTDFH